MRLRPEKIEKMAARIHAALDANDELTVLESRDQVVGLIKRVIADDLKAEDDLETEVREILEEHRAEIDRSGASFEKLVLKRKQQLARERKMVL